MSGRLLTLFFVIHLPMLSLKGEMTEMPSFFPSEGNWRAISFYEVKPTLGGEDLRRAIGHLKRALRMERRSTVEEIFRLLDGQSSRMFSRPARTLHFQSFDVGGLLSDAYPSDTLSTLAFSPRGFYAHHSPGPSALPLLSDSNIPCSSTARSDGHSATGKHYSVRSAAADSYGPGAVRGLLDDRDRLGHDVGIAK